jgi:hypothetical protein
VTTTRALTGVLSSEVSRVVEETFGVDTFQITPSLQDPNAPSTSGWSPDALTVLKRVERLTTHSPALLVQLPLICSDRRPIVLVDPVAQRRRLLRLDWRVRNS